MAFSSPDKVVLLAELDLQTDPAAALKNVEEKLAMLQAESFQYYKFSLEDWQKKPKALRQIVASCTEYEEAFIYINRVLYDFKQDWQKRVQPENVNKILWLLEAFKEKKSR